MNLDGRAFARTCFSFGGGFPFQQAIARDEASDQGSHDGIEHQKSLMCQQGEVESSRKQQYQGIANRLANISALLRHAGSNQGEQKLHNHWNDDDQQSGHRPVAGRSRKP